MRKYLWLGAACVMLCGGNLSAGAPSEEDRIERETDLMEWLGVVRYFHPSDAVEDTDWEPVLHKLVQIAAYAEDDEQFVDQVHALLEPAMVGMQLGEDVREEELHAEDCDEAPLRWKHAGFDAWPSLQIGGPHSPYNSRRDAWPEDRTGLGEEALASTWRMELMDGREVSLPLSLCPEEAEQSGAPELGDFEMGDIAEDYSHMARYAVVTLAPVMKHFYPYPEAMDQDWDDWVRSGLQEAREVTERDELKIFMEHFLRPLNDGHIRVSDMAKQPEPGFLPIDIAWKEESAVVIQVARDAETALEPGDRITEIDGHSVQAWREMHDRRISGSNQYRDEVARQDFLITENNSTASLALKVQREGEEKDLETAYDANDPLYTPKWPGFHELAEGVFYVDLRALEKAELSEHLEDLKTAEAIVFDVRGHPTDAEQAVLPHLLEQEDDWDDWMRVLMPTGPDGDLVRYEAMGWEMTPGEELIDAEVAFLTDGSAISYAESIIGMAKKHELGTVVGTPTAGANGNVIGVNVVAGFGVMFTGMQVVNPDGQTFQAKGLQPDVTAEADPDALAAGRDPVLEKALEVLGQDPEIAR